MAKRADLHSKLPTELRVEILNYQPFVEIGKKKKRKLYVNWNQVWSGSISRHSRAAFETQLKGYLKVFILRAIAKTNFELPKDWIGNISTSLEIHKKKTKRWDTDNQTIWFKAFHDTLVDMEFIPDDDISVIKQSGQVTWFEIDKEDNVSPNKLVFIIKKI